LCAFFHSRSPRPCKSFCSFLAVGGTLNVEGVYRSCCGKRTERLEAV
jgi:hypothetical protein